MARWTGAKADGRRQSRFYFFLGRERGEREMGVTSCPEDVHRHVDC